MRTETNEKNEAWGWEEYLLLAGTAVGLVAFIAIGVIPAIVYGGYAALALYAEIIGGPVEPTLAARAFITLGMVLGVVSVGAFFATVGMLLGLIGVGMGNAVKAIANLGRAAKPAEAAPARAPAPSNA